MIQLRELRKVYRLHKREQVVLDSLTMDILPGQRLGLLGRNGAGKSTLLRMLGKVELPTSGSVRYSMRVSWPLGFTGAFQGSLSGFDNIRFISRIYRYDYQRLVRFIDEFSELGEHLYKPVKNYSAGMRARLAFALSIAIDFDCYLIDEVILVGDHRFHERCRSHLFDQKAGRTLIIASHDSGLLTEVCDSALVLGGGKAVFHTDVRAAMQSYLAA